MLVFTLRPRKVKMQHGGGQSLLCPMCRRAVESGRKNAKHGVAFIPLTLERRISIRSSKPMSETVTYSCSHQQKITVEA